MGYGYGGGGYGSGFALIVVLFIPLIIVGAVYMGGNGGGLIFIFFLRAVR